MLYILASISVSIGIFISGIVFYNYDNLKTVYTIISLKKKSTVSTSKVNRLKFFYNFIVLLCNFCLTFLSFYKLSLIQKFNSSLVKIDKNLYIVSYIIEGKIYKMVVKANRNPSQILQISDDSNEDITDKILPYLGPKMDFHNTSLSPSFFLCKSLTFQLCTGEEFIFHDTENIKLSTLT